MDTSFSVWHWLVVLVAAGVPLLLLVRHRRRRAAAVANAPPTGIGGWLALFAGILCAGLLKSVAELALGMPDYLSGFQNKAAHGPLAAVGLIALAIMAVQVWAIVALFQKKRVLRTACAILWILMLLAPVSLLSMLTVPGVTLNVILPAEDILRSIAALTFMGLWYWYLCVSTRVRNTLVN